MKVINFELSKRLYEKGLIDFKQNEYSRFFRIDDEGNSLAICKHNDNYNEFLEEYKEYPTFTLEEAIEFLPYCISINKNGYYMQMGKKYIGYYTTIPCGFKKLEEFSGNNILEAIEKMIEYLLDNNLIN